MKVIISIMLCALIIGCCQKNTSDKQKLIIMAEKGLKSNYNASFEESQAKIIKGDQVQEWIKNNTKNRIKGVRKHANDVLGKYISSSDCFALVVENIDNKITQEILMIHIPKEYRNDKFGISNYLIANKNDVVATPGGGGVGGGGAGDDGGGEDEEEETWCHYCEGENPNLAYSLSDMDLNDSSDCVCICECNLESTGPCGNNCTDC